nr:MAG TPA: hypothetical protein [Caudoviricetes sp.]
MFDNDRKLIFAGLLDHFCGVAFHLARTQVVI